MYKAWLNDLKLTYHPISCQKAAGLLEDNEAFRKAVANANLYMVAHRENIIFSNVEYKEGYIQVDFLSGEESIKGIKLPDDQFLFDEGRFPLHTSESINILNDSTDEILMELTKNAKPRHSWRG